MNNIQLLGRTTQNLELKNTTNGKAVCTFDLAVPRKYSKDITDFLTCVAWGKTAEMLAKYVVKGQLIAVDGSLQTRKFQDKNGNNRTAYEIKVDNFYFAESKKSTNVDVGVDPLQSVSEKLNNAGVNNSVDDFNFIDTDSDLPL
jgi:single-strand DNA-binding protein